MKLKYEKVIRMKKPKESFKELTDNESFLETVKRGYGDAVFMKCSEIMADKQFAHLGEVDVLSKAMYELSKNEIDQATSIDSRPFFSD